MQVELIIIGIVALAGGLLSGIVANAKNRDVFGWVVAGALFPLLGLIAVAGMPVASPKSAENTSTTESNESPSAAPRVPQTAQKKFERNFLIVGVVVSVAVLLLVINVTYG
jgi:hypothetical protein